MNAKPLAHPTGWTHGFGGRRSTNGCPDLVAGGCKGEETIDAQSVRTSFDALFPQGDPLQSVPTSSDNQRQRPWLFLVFLIQCLPAFEFYSSCPNRASFALWKACFK